MTKKPSRLTQALLETANGMHRVGVIGDDAFQKITIRHLGEAPLRTARPITPDEIRTLRERANLSQAAFARYLNLTSGYVSQLERGAKHLRGPALALLNVIRAKGIEVVL
jgi:putative transcriptional regulator